MKVLLKLVVLGAAVWLVAAVVDGVDVREDVTSYAVVAVLFGLVNAFLKPVLKVLGFPFVLLTLGLFLLVINAALFGLVAALTDRMTVDSTGAAVLGALLLSAATWVGETVLGLRGDD